MFQLFNSPEDALADGGKVTELSADDILNELNKTDEEPNISDGEETSDKKEKETETKEEKEVKDEETKDEELDELAQLEEELKEPTDEDLELKTPVQRRALMKDYPDIFKKHPGLESTIYRERAYTELLPTIGDAKEALASLQTLERFENDLKQGKTTDIMKAVLADDPKAFAKLADNYLDNLKAVDVQAHDHVLGNITKDIVAAMISFGKETENEELQNAAGLLYQFMFNSTKWEGKRKLSADDVVNDTVAKERAELNRQKLEWEQSKQKENTDKVLTSVNNQIKGTIEKTIDVKNQMTPFVKSKAIEEVLNKASHLLEKDTRFQAIIKTLKDRAVKEKFSDESLNRIKSAYFTKYKSVLIPIVKAVKNEALKGVVTRTKSKSDENNDTTERANRGDRTTRTDKVENKDFRNKPKPNESSLDFLMR